MMAIADDLMALRGFYARQKGWSSRTTKRRFVLTFFLVLIPITLLVSLAICWAFEAAVGRETSAFTFLFSGLVVPVLVAGGVGRRWDEDQSSTMTGAGLRT